MSLFLQSKNDDRISKNSFKYYFEREQDCKRLQSPVQRPQYTWSEDQTLRCIGRLSKKGRRVDALALRADERRDKLR